MLLTRDVNEYFPFKKDRLLLETLIGSVPFAGVFYVFRKIGLEHYKTGESSTTAVSVGLLGMDEIFNPSAKPNYTIEKMLEDSNGVDETGAAAGARPDS